MSDAVDNLLTTIAAATRRADVKQRKNFIPNFHDRTWQDGPPPDLLAEYWTGKDAHCTSTRRTVDGSISTE